MSRPGDGTPDVAYWLHEGKTIPKKDPAEKPPWAEPAEKRPWVAAPLRPEVWTGRAVPQADGKAEVWYRTAESKAAVPKGAAEDDPAAAGWKALGFQVPTYPAHIFRVFALPDGRVGGSGGSYLGNFVYDPATNIAAHLGRLPLSHYSEAVHDGKVYMSGYPSSALYVYDPAKPWTVGRPPGPGTPPLAEDHAQSNPRRVAYLSHHGSGCHKMWSSAVGADGRVYFGGRWYRDGEGGGLGWWDPKAEKPGGLWEPFSNCQVAFITATGQGRYIVASTRAVRDAVLKKPTPQQARLFVFDTMTGQISREIEPVPNAEWTGAVAGVDGDHVLALTVDAAGRAAAKANGATDRDIAYGQCDTASILYKVNVVTGDVLWRKRLPWPVGFCTNENFDHHDGFDFHLGPDGRVWTFTGARFVRVNPNKDWHYSYVNCALVRIDPKDGTLEVVGRLDRGGTMAFVGRDLYLSGGCKYLTDGEHLRRIRSVVP
jgi:hypothetical protein